MTEKQSISFIQMPPTKDFYIRCQECCDWLNNLIKENKQLKQENKELKHQLSQQEMEYATTAYRQAEENEELKQENNRIYAQLIMEINNETELLVEAKKSNVDANTLTCIQGRIKLLKNLKKCFHQ